jgi:hypothetical protein
VLKGETKGYKNHPQLERFKQQENPIAALDAYLLGIWEEATQRNYVFNREKIGPHFSTGKITVTSGQLHYEFEHLKTKLMTRDMERYQKIAEISTPRPHPIFRVMDGDIEAWERVPLNDK